MNIFITYSDEKYAEARHLCARMAACLGRFDRVIEYSPEDIDPEFRRRYARTFAVQRGAGLWLWKPYIMLKTLEEVAHEGDVVFYTDAGTFFIRHFKHILKTMTQDVWVSNIPLTEKQYTKKEAFVLMGCEGRAFEDTPQVQGGFVGIRKSPQSMAFVKEWLTYSCDYRILSPECNPAYPETDCFIAHREDQSVLSLLCKKHGISFHKDPTQYGRFPEKYSRPYHLYVPAQQTGEYPVMILLHRQPKVTVRHIFNQLLHVILPKRVVRLFLSKVYYER